MKKQLLILATALISFGAMAQSNVMNDGDLMINAGIGVGFRAYSSPITNGLSSVLSLHVSGEKGMFPTGDVGIVSLGGNLDVGFSGSPYTSSVDFVSQILFRAAWHLSILDNKEWDVYAGGGAGVQFGTEEDWVSSSTGFTGSYERSGYVRPGYAGFLGGRWMMKETIGLFGEVGTGSISSVRFGVTFKM